MSIRNLLVASICTLLQVGIVAAQTDPTIAIIGTGDKGDSPGPRLAGLGYKVVYGSRDPPKTVQGHVNRERQQIPLSIIGL